MKRSRTARRNRAPIVIATATTLTLLVSVAHADGFRPFARDDSATVKRGAAVSVLDSGARSVLDNDFDLEGDELIAVLATNPKHGELELFEDGTFVYRHNGNSEDEDSFRYRAFDGTSFSRRAEVEIEIVPGDPIAPVIVGQRNVSVDEDASTTITFADLIVEDPDSDYPNGFRLEVSDGENYSRTNATITPLPNFNGALSVPVRVNDGSLDSNRFDLRVDVEPRNDPPFVVRPVPAQEATEGALFSLALSDHFADIDDGDTLRFSASGLPGSGTLRLDPASGLLSGTPIRADAVDPPYEVRVTATDDAGAEASLTFELVIFPDDRADLAVAARVRENPTLVGAPSVWTIEVENKGPANLEEGELVSSWTTAGPTLTLSAPGGCAVAENSTPRPTLRCALAPLSAGETFSVDVEGLQDGAGDNTLIVIAEADDPIDGNNMTRVSAQVAQAFGGEAAQRLQGSSSDMTIADFNSDGLLDLAVINDELSLYMNDGQRRFDVVPVAVGAGGSLVTALDWNGDGAADLASVGLSAGDVRVHIGDGAGSFAAEIGFSIDAAGSVSAMRARDVDGDGIDELLLAGSFGVRQARSRGDGSAALDVVSSIAAMDIATFDVDTDGFADLGFVAADDRRIHIMRNVGGNGFDEAGQIDAGWTSAIAPADVDRDGTVDLILAIEGDAQGPPYVQIMRGMGPLSFEFDVRLGASMAEQLLAGDVDGNGFDDIIVVNRSGVHQIYYGDAAGSFTLGAEQIVSEGMRHGLIVDFNGDDSLDLILGGFDASTIELHANNGIGRLGPGDTQAPELVLLGEANVTLAAGAAFVDPGATANDDIDGDLTEQIVVSGSIDTNVVGTHKLVYTVADRASNTSTASRTIVVGVNSGPGGGGGGSLSAAFVALLSILAGLALKRRRSLVRRRL